MSVTASPVVGAARIVKLRFFYDIMCPNSWLGYLSLQQKYSADHPSTSIDFIPVCDQKIKLFSASRKLETPHTQVHASSLIRENKELLENSLNIPFPEDYKEIQKHYIEQGSVFLPSNYLSTIQMYKPEYYRKALEHIGHRVWTERKPVHMGAHFSTVSREIGLEYRESEFIVSHLSHRNPRKYLDSMAEEAAKLGATRSPWVSLVSEDGTTDNFGDFNRIFKFVL